MANGLAHPKDLPSSFLILEWSSVAHTGQIPRRQKVAKATGGLRSLSPCPAGQIAALRLAVEREVSSYPGRILASRRKQLRPVPPTWEERERLSTQPEEDIYYSDSSSGAWEREPRGYRQRRHKSPLDFHCCGPAPEEMQSWKPKLGHV